MISHYTCLRRKKQPPWGLAGENGDAILKTQVIDDLNRRGEETYAYG
jgi:hypothetical protein